VSKQHHTRFLPETQSEAGRREKALRYAFLNSTSATGRRPSGKSRSRLNNAARKSNATRPWELFADPLRDVAVDAAKCDRAVQDLTEERIIEACIALLHYVLEPLDGRTVGEVTYLGVCKEVPEAVEAITVAKFDPTPDKIATAQRESCEAARALQLHKGGLRTTPAGQTGKPYMRPRGATPPLSIA
jgi:hypothetical protein